MATQRSSTRKATRTSFGNVRRLPSGRWQARFTDAREERHAAPVTFASKREAEDYLATVRADMVRGAWRAPQLGAVTLADYSASLLAVRVDLAPKTRQLYEELSRLWIDATHELPPGRGGVVRTINLGETELGSLTVAVIREWYVAAICTTDKRAAARAIESERRRREKVRESEAAGCPGPGQPASVRRPAPRANPPGRARVAQAYRYLKTVLQQAARDGRIDANPCQIPSAGLIRTPERVPATPEQVDALAAAMPPRWAAAVQVAAWSGLRAGELFGLTRRHVDLEAGTLRVERGQGPLVATGERDGERLDSGATGAILAPCRVCRSKMSQRTPMPS